MRYRLVVADVDGTLVERGGEVSDRLREAVAAYQARGGLFTLATGRPTEAARHYLEDLAIQLPAIIFNGAQVFDFRHNRPLWAAGLPVPLARRALELARHYPVEPFLYLSGEILVAEESPEVADYARKDRIVCRPVGDLALYLADAGGAEPPPKLLFIGPVEASLELIGRLDGEGLGPVNWVQSESDYIEILPRDTTKGTALERLASLLDVPLERVMAIGDQLNDLEMVRRAGAGVAVANAAPGLKTVADLVMAGRHGAGVVEALELALADDGL